MDPFDILVWVMDLLISSIWKFLHRSVILNYDTLASRDEEDTSVPHRCERRTVRRQGTKSFKIIQLSWGQSNSNGMGQSEAQCLI